MGWLTNEELRYTEKGDLLNHSPTTYKIPGIYDIPPVFNCDTIENYNTPNVRGTKAVGEPPLLLGISVWTAIKHALSFVASDKLPCLTVPATGEEILSRITAFTKESWPEDKNGDRFENLSGMKIPVIKNSNLRPVSASVARAISGAIIKEVKKEEKAAKTTGS